eukprot:scaffold11866_cov117-Isochrysis_galbana.AAC.1
MALAACPFYISPVPTSTFPRPLRHPWAARHRLTLCGTSLVGKAALMPPATHARLMRRWPQDEVTTASHGGVGCLIVELSCAVRGRWTGGGASRLGPVASTPAAPSASVTTGAPLLCLYISAESRDSLFGGAPWSRPWWRTGNGCQLPPILLSLLLSGVLWFCSV